MMPPLFLLILWLVALPGPGEATDQLLYKESPRYENYGEQGYRHYGRGVLGRSTRPLFDRLGDQLMNGVEIYSLGESRVEAELVPPGSRLNKHFFYYRYLNGLAVAQDSYNGWTTRLLIGDRIRTHFTPLTLDLAALNGIRWDVEGSGHRLSLVTSRRDFPLWTLPDVDQNQELSFSTYLLGGHWERDWGPFKLGATFTNQLRVNTLVGTEGSSIKGTTPSTITTVQMLVVKVANAAERLHHNARVYGIDLALNGEPTDIEPVVTRHDANFVNPRFENFDEFFPLERTVPPFVDFIEGDFPAESPDARGGIQVSDSEYLLYWFELPEDQVVHEASFDALVANNYEISVSEVFVRNPLAGKRDPGQRNRATYFARIVGSEEPALDGSNMRRVRFDYGRQTGNMVFGANAQTAFKGFLFRGEFDVNLNHLQYPDLEGARHRREALAYFVNLERELGPRVAIGGEYFNVDPDYSTSITVQSEGYAAYTDLPVQPYVNEIHHGFPGDYNNTIEMDTVDDNDDRDPFADSYFIPTQGDTDGVFPGLDEDLDGRPDINENDNALPDYVEPFMLYRVDPDEFEYGDDLNNNGVIDVRENDLKPDYPYDRNLRGWHLFGEWRPLSPLTLTLGRYDTRQLWGSGENAVSYAKAEYKGDFAGLARVRAVNFLKRVRDDIRNDVFRFTFSSTGFGTVFAEDLLRMQNSLANSAFAEIELYHFRPFHIRLRTLLETNRQWATAHTGVNWMRRSATVLRSDYTWKLGALSVMPQMKLMVQKATDDAGRIHPLHELYYYPIFKIYWHMTPDTALRLGAQGFPFLESRFRDFEQGDNGYDARDYMIGLTNVSSYSGYQLGLSVGYHLKTRRMVDRRRAFVDQDYTLFFLRLIAGLNPSQNL